jgi:hypothetical protein
VLFRATFGRRALVYTTVSNSPGYVGLYAGASNGPTQGMAAMTWNPTVHWYNTTVPFKYQWLDFMVNSTTNATTTVDLNYPPGGTVWPQLAPYALNTWELQLGPNGVRINSTLDGFYRVEFTRLLTDLLSIAASPVAATPGWTILPDVDILPLADRTVIFSNYTASVPCSVGYVQLNVSFLTAGSITAIAIDGTTQILTSNSLSTPLQLKSGQWNNITLVSSMDGVYNVWIWRDLPDTSVFIIGAYDIESVLTPITVLTPVWTPGTYVYTITVPYGTASLSVNTSSISGHPEYLSITGNADPFGLNFQAWNDITVNNTVDGIFRIIVLWAPPDIKGVAVYTSLDTKALIYSTVSIPAHKGVYSGFASGGPTQGTAGSPWAPTTHWYSIGPIPFKYASVIFMINATTNGTSEVDFWNPPPTVVFPQWNPPSWTALPLIIGVTEAHLNSTLDGRYRFQIERLPTDLIQIDVNPLQATVGMPVLPCVLGPSFSRSEILSYSAIVSLGVGSVQLNVTFLTPGSARIIGTTGVIYPLVNSVWSGTIPLWPRWNNLTLVSDLDGNYTVAFYRELPDTGNFTIFAYDAEGVPTFIPMTITAGTYLYPIVVPYGTQELSVSAVSLSGHPEYLSLPYGGEPFTLAFQAWNDVTLNNTKVR